MSRHTMDFTYEHEMTVSGLIACNAEIEGRAAFSFRPGSPATGPSYACGGQPAEDPEIEIDGIQVFGHAPEMLRADGYRGEYRDLAPSDPLYDAIADWLMRAQLDEMTAEAAADIESSLAQAEDWRAEMSRSAAE